MPGHVRNKNLQLDDDDYYDDDYYDDYDEDDYYDEPVSAPKPRQQPLTKANAPKGHFDGISWSSIPLGRLGNIVELPRHPRGQLLGGSGKPSKLQALAAQRRKHQDEKKRGNEIQGAADSSAVSILDKLNAATADSEERTTVVKGVKLASRYKRQKTEAPQETVESDLRGESPPVEDSIEKTDEPRYSLRAGPSLFATALLRPVQAPNVSIDSWHYRLRTVDGKTNADPLAGPSPDDVVSKAQSKGNKSAKVPQSSKPASNSLTQAVAALKVSEAPNVKSKNLDVSAEFAKSKTRRSANFVVIGHVDHGKSTLMGRLLLDLKHPNLSSRDFEKLQKSSQAIGKGSFALAWAMDSREDEREHGVTIDYATRHFSTDTTDFTILDAPGHQDYVKNMIAGTAQADFAVLVIDASSEAFESGLRGQTREHALLARSLGVTRLVVAINKMDTARWSKERFDEIVAQLQGFFTAAGFHQEHVTFVPCAGLTGDNVARPLTAQQKQIAPWYQGPTLVQALEASNTRERQISGPLRFVVSSVYRGATTGAPTGDVTVDGLVDSGNLQMGTNVLAQPSGATASIRAIEVGGESRDWVVAGQIATLHLVGTQEEHLRSGDVLCEKNNREVQNVKSFTAKCLAFESLLPSILAFHCGQLYCSTKIQFLEVIGKDGAAATSHENATKKKRKKPKVVHPQQVVRLQVEMHNDEKGLPLEVGNRVVFREEGKTVATGIIDGIEVYAHQP